MSSDINLTGLSRYSGLVVFQRSPALMQAYTASEPTKVYNTSEREA
jgi:hypothetical protein